MLNIPTINSKVRDVGVTVVITNTETEDTATFTKNDSVKSVEITRVGDNSKFFGFGVSHKLSLKLVNVSDEDVETFYADYRAHSQIKVTFNCDTYPNTQTYTYNVFPTFYVSEVHRNEKTGEYSITAYDRLHRAEEVSIQAAELSPPYTLLDVANAIANLMTGHDAVLVGSFDLTTSYQEGANLEGNESIKSVLDALAEVTQTIYYINHNDRLVIKTLDYTGNPVYTINKDLYNKLQTGLNRKIVGIASVTQLGDNYISTTGHIGTVQQVRDNPFWELRTDIATLVDAAVANVGDSVIGQFEVDWRGNPALEIGDKIAVVATDDETTTVSYVLDDSFKFTGGLICQTQWEFQEDDTEPDANPTNLGDALRQTYAKVDKVNKDVEIVASDISSLTNEMASIKLTTDSVNTTVQSIQQSTQDSLDSMSNDISTLTNKVNAAITAEDVTIVVETALQDGVNEVTTTTGFKFNDEGLSISKTGSEMETVIDEDGMTIYRNNTEVLDASNEGVTAYNLHANTYLIVGDNSRFEDYDSGSRTGCFWIGG
jgi:hypothetical protein